MASANAMGVDTSMLELFRAEIEIHLPVLSEGLLTLEKDPVQPKLLEALMRAAHSIKGAAKIVGVELAVRIAHVMEDRFVAAQKGQITVAGDAVDVLLRGVDALQHISAADDGQDASLSESDVQQLVDDIAAARSDRGRVSVAESPAPVMRQESKPSSDSGPANRSSVGAATSMQTK